jgi:hypothetical protein
MVYDLSTLRSIAVRSAMKRFTQCCVEMPRAGLSAAGPLRYCDPRYEADNEVVGVSAAELADLVIGRRIGIIDDHVVMADPVQAGPTDRVGDYVLGCVADQQKSYTVRTWVGSLGEAVTDLVVRELVDEGVVRHQRGSLGLRGRKPDRFPAMDLLRASSSRNRVRHMLTHPAEFDLAGATVASMVGALGAERVFEVHDARDVLKELNTYLPQALQAVVAGLAAAVAAASVALGGR